MPVLAFWPWGMRDINSLNSDWTHTTCTGRLCNRRQSLNHWIASEVPTVRSVQLLSRVRLLATPRTVAYQASLSITNSRNLLKLMSIESVMPSNHLIFCCSLLLLPSIFPSIRVFSNELMLHLVAKVLELQFLLHATHYTVSLLLFHLILKTVKTTLRCSHILVGLFVFFKIFFYVDHF